MRSVVVVFPASMCAMMPMLRYFSSATVRPESVAVAMLTAAAPERRVERDPRPGSE